MCGVEVGASVETDLLQGNTAEFHGATKQNCFLPRIKMHSP